jgi:hypothetical protein
MTFLSSAQRLKIFVVKHPEPIAPIFHTIENKIYSILHKIDALNLLDTTVQGFYDTSAPGSTTLLKNNLSSYRVVGCLYLETK